MFRYYGRFVLDVLGCSRLLRTKFSCYIIWMLDVLDVLGFRRNCAGGREGEGPPLGE